VKWIHGAPDCALSTDPLIQMQAFDDDSFILRLSKCYSFEGDFIYLLAGRSTSIRRRAAKGAPSTAPPSALSRRHGWGDAPVVAPE